MPVAATLATTTTLHDLEGGSYRKGACIIWSPKVRATTDAPVKNVPCSEPHFLEITGSVELPGKMNFPSTDATWNVLSAEHCDPLTRAHLGYALVPSGRFHTSYLRPTEEGWRVGDRSLECGIAARSDHATEASNPPDEVETPFTGTVKGQSQERIPPTGTCFASDPTDAGLVPVACGLEHTTEVTGHIGLAERLDHPPNDDDLAGPLGRECRSLAIRYLGRPLRRDESESWLPFTDEEWAAGWRTLPCTIGRWRGETRVGVTGSLAAQ
jgi:hypothetical protein